ncbi:MAG: HNH endonuclease [Bacteroidia bacterium]|nr:HNH endonuclease [Bacteroidia bacterium]
MSDMYVGVTDNDWFKFLRDRQPDEVNFWKPKGTPFKALQPGGLFFFKLHAPLRKIAGYGIFVEAPILPLKLAWDAFGEKNGVSSLNDLQRRIARYRRDHDPNPYITCIMLAQPVFRPDEGWMQQPSAWGDSIVSGKGYEADSSDGKRMYKFAEELLSVVDNGIVADNRQRYQHRLQKVRYGQGTFRILVTESYQRRCAITGERTLPVLEAAHIKPYALDGQHNVQNGLLLRSDVHTLFDDGYITVTTDHRVEVSRRIKEQYENGRDYYKHHGNKLIVLPSVEEQPDRDLLLWHNEHVYQG